MSAEVAAKLHPPRFPESFTGIGPADLLLAFGLGLLLAALLLMLLRPVMRGRKHAEPWHQRLQTAADLPPSEAMPRLAALAQERGLSLTMSESDALYRSPSPEVATALAQRLKQHGGRR